MIKIKLFCFNINDKFIVLKYFMPVKAFTCVIFGFGQ